MRRSVLFSVTMVGALAFAIGQVYAQGGGGGGGGAGGGGASAGAAGGATGTGGATGAGEPGPISTAASDRAAGAAWAAAE